MLLLVIPIIKSFDFIALEIEFENLVPINGIATTPVSGPVANNMIAGNQPGFDNLAGFPLPLLLASSNAIMFLAIVGAMVPLAAAVGTLE